MRAGLEALGRGEGSAVWVEGEPGIGKSSLVAEALAEAGQPGWDIGWGTADVLAERLPLRLMQDCLQVRPGSSDPRRAHAASLLRSGRLGLFADGDASVAGIEALLMLVDELCAAAPTVLVVDDVQWADDASLIVWQQLAASIRQLRLLLIGTCRPALRRPEVLQVRRAVTRAGGAVISLGPLAETDVVALVAEMAGAPPGEALQRLAAQAAGNPLYVHELVDALVREQALQVGAGGVVSLTREQLPVSLGAALGDRLSYVGPETAQMLRAAALLGGRFAIADLAVVLRRPVSDLAVGVQEAVAAGILAGSGQELAFRHLLIRQVLYESMPAGLRTALHAEAARELATVGADALSVAQQLAAAKQPGNAWARRWLTESVPALATRAPRLTADLLASELDATPAGEDAPDELRTGLVRALLAAGSYHEAATQARRAQAVMTSVVSRAETHWMLARAQVSAGDNDEAIASIGRALASTDMPGEWRARILAFLAMLQRNATGDLNVADATAHKALAIAEQTGDAFATAHALADLWLTHAVRRDHAAALGYLDRALDVLDGAGHPDLRAFILNARIFTLQNLDRWPHAELAVKQAREFAAQSGIPDNAIWATAAVLRYWLGQWDDALAELGAGETENDADTYLRERWPALLAPGVAALITGRRDQRTEADRYLRQGLALPIHTLTDRENQDFLVAAEALALEQQGQSRQAKARLAALLPRREAEMTLLHQWLPDLVRLALATGDSQTAQAAAQACQAEAAAETRAARAAAASLRCRGLLDFDPDPLRDAVAHYRTVGPAVELPAALEDLAVVLAGRGSQEDARVVLNEAVSLYQGMQARWDIRRAEGRLRPLGIRRGIRGPRHERRTTGWAALTPTESKIAHLVSGGKSNPDIAAELYLSRNTVQTHVSHILTKLGCRSRIDIAIQVLNQG